jgi:hypothetical protein
MSFQVTFDPILIEFSLEQREAWYAGERSDCIGEYCRNLPGTMGFGEYLAGKYWEQRGYRWVHHDYNVFGGNKPGKYPESEAILENAVGVERLAACRKVYRTLYPLREEHHVPFEEPDLLIYKPGTKEIRFAECKRADTRDSINRRQLVGLFLLGAVLQCPVDVFLIAEQGTVPVPTPITFTYGDDA